MLGRKAHYLSIENIFPLKQLKAAYKMLLKNIEVRWYILKYFFIKSNMKFSHVSQLTQCLTVSFFYIFNVVTSTFLKPNLKA